MSTEANTNLTIQQSSEDFVVSEPWSIENYADGLMDELFADIDCVLDAKGGLSIPTIEPEFVRLQTIRMSSVVLPDTEKSPVSGSTSIGKRQLRKVAVKKPTSPHAGSKNHQNPKSRQWLGKLLTMGVTLGVAIAGFLLVKNSGLFNNFNYQSAQEAVSPSSPMGHQTGLASQVDIQADMVNYMLNSLAAIDRQQTKSNFRSARTTLNANVAAGNGLSGSANDLRRASFASSNGSSITSKLPPPLTANNTSPYSNTTTGVERVYVPIPVYNAPLPMRYAPPSIPGVRSPLPPVPGTQVASRNLQIPSPKTTSNTTNKLGKPLNMFAAVRPGLKSVNVQTTPITLRQPKAPVIPIVPFRVIPPKLPVTVTKTVETQPSSETISPSTTSNYLLEGVLESAQKEKSTALFQVNGVSRRIQIGEGIGTSGWTLVEIANGEAVVRRNGEVRSIYTGQKF
jgi:Type II secretion system protein C